MFLGPFGEPLRATGPMARANPFRFSTKYCDDETGLCYYGYRYYDANKGRWLGRDPIAERGGPNLYGFCRNNDVSLIDPFGLEGIDRIIGAAIGGVVSGGVGAVTTLLTGGSGKDALIAAAGGFAGGFVTTALLYPPPLMSPQAAGAIGGAVQGFVSGVLTEIDRYKKMDGKEPKIRVAINVAASTTFGTVFGGVAGGTGERIGEVWGRVFRLNIGVQVEIEGCTLVTDAGLGIAARSFGVMQDAGNSAYDAGKSLMNQNVNILEEKIKIEERFQTHPK